MSYPGIIIILSGGRGRIRTIDLSLNLSYILKFAFFLPLVGVDGFEPSTSVLSGLRSNQLSYTPLRPPETTNF